MRLPPLKDMRYRKIELAVMASPSISNRPGADRTKRICKRDEKNKNVAARKFTPTAALIYDSPVY